MTTPLAPPDDSACAPSRLCGCEYSPARSRTRSSPPGSNAVGAGAVGAGGGAFGAAFGRGLLARGGFSASCSFKMSPCGGSSSWESTGMGGVSVLLCADLLVAPRPAARLVVARGGRSAVALLDASRFWDCSRASLVSPCAVTSAGGPCSAWLAAGFVLPVFAARDRGRSPSVLAGG